MAKPRLLLLGTLGAGKTSLLGAFAQAAATQEALLKGRLADPQGDWDRLRKITYNGKPPAAEESVAHDLCLDPAADKSPRVEAIVTDPGGKSAQRMLQANQPIGEVDAVLLAVDASLAGKQLADEFQQFAQWLTALQTSRAKRTQIGELPVYLVLTKCDLLAKKEDTFARWMQRIEEGKRRIDERFRDLLKEQRGGFGTVELQLWGTAIKRPALTDRPAKPEEPLGVAELFRQSLGAAADFQDRRRASQSRLQNLVVAALGITAILALAVALLFEYQPGDRNADLEQKLQPLLPKKDAAAKERLQGSVKKLEEKQKALRAVEHDAGFSQLPRGVQESAAKYDAELEQYLQARRDSAVMLKLPYLAKNQEELAEMEKNAAAFALPAEYAKAWQETPLARQIEKTHREFAALHAALADEDKWIHAQIDAGTALLKKGTQIYGKLLNKEKVEPEEAEAWQRECRARLHPKLQMPREELVKGVSRLTYEDLGRFAPVQKSLKDWEASKRKLRKMSDSIQDEVR